MRAFISYADDNGESSEFAEWLYGALKRPGSPVEPWWAPVDLVPVNTFEKRIPQAVSNCRILLFVRTEYTPDSNACMDELRWAREFGKTVIALRIGPVKYSPLVDFLPSEDFSADRERALEKLFRRIATLDQPEGQIAQLEEQLRRKRDSFRRLDGPSLAIAEREAEELEARLKERHAQVQADAEPLGGAPVGQVPPRTGTAGAEREDAADVLREIHGDEAPIVVIVGPEGVGKTTLVRGVLERAAAEAVSTEYRQAHGPHSFTAHDLLELIKDAVDEVPAAAAALLARPDVAVTRKLEVLIGLLGNKRMAVVLDSCEVLLDAVTGKLLSSDLDDALEVLAGAHPTMVKVLLVTREQPFARSRRWLAKALTFSLSRGMPLADFTAHLAGLDPRNAYELNPAPAHLVRALHERTGGRPRAAEVVHGILSGARAPETERSPLTCLDEVVQALAEIAPDEALDFLTGRLIDGLAPEVRRILQAVAAFGAPVDAEAVAYMLPGVASAQITRGLNHLRDRHLVRRTTENRYYVQPPDDSRALDPVRPFADQSDPVDVDRRGLIFRAASYFALRRRAHDEVRGLDDLVAELAEIDLLVQAGDHDGAFRLVDNVDDHLDNWGCRWVLRRRREQLTGALHDDLSEIMNLQALGDIAQQGGDLAAAESYFRQAMSYLVDRSWDDVRKKLFVSLGAVAQLRGDMAKAEEHYGHALAIAREHGGAEAEMVPLVDLAECHRHRGDLAKATECLAAATTLARARVRREPTRDARRRLAEVLLKSGMRHADLGEFDRAKAALDEAGAEAAEIDSWVVRCRHSDAEANLHLLLHKANEARETGHRGLELALALGRRPLLRRVYTTLVMCSLYADDLDGAAEYIRLAAKGRSRGEALVTLALAGLVEHRRGDHWSAQNSFRRLRFEADERSRRDERDFGALDMAGFARCGEHLRRDGPALDEAIEVFRQARRVTSAPGITGKLVQMLGFFHEPRLQRAITAAAGG
ncbi:tetratricopeptide repeat protein [Actinokineospora globicatena]|uniref:tetratricopeptide repeat protein n=1 Tax=Actinokineospora globicatena TaxID=103729 RepID=UPI0020A55CB9|nr:tetratricopeptide repeat protein [Actinokineospora globicatena]MCP2302955.1 ATP-, maltotriose- and DNA-dependent transcriptional regulator MalT [Actinokineospora globicatena]GLW78656.1 hypothetical protein Aglo01_31380 [Actinokineospora globicatena]GLW84676.1 hypothetical protein Aglo02_23160 [Actinokineospora globicatena]